MLKRAPRPTSIQLGTLSFFLALMGNSSFLWGRGGRRGWLRAGGLGGLALGGRLRVRRGLGVALRRACLAGLGGVGDVEAAALEDQARAPSHQPLQRGPLAFRALPERLVPHGLELLEMVAALGAFVLVGGHRWGR